MMRHTRSAPMLPSELQRVDATPSSRLRDGSRLIRFSVNGYDVVTCEATARMFPDTYIDWLVTNCEEDVAHGRPIRLKASPAYFSRLIRRLSGLREEKQRQGKSWKRKIIRTKPDSKRRRALDPPPFTDRRKYIPVGKRISICKIETSFPCYAREIDANVKETVAAIVESVGILWQASKSYFDRLVVLLTMGKTYSGIPVVWPYVLYTVNTHTYSVSELALVQNEEIREMLPEELEDLYGTVDISPELQHLIKFDMRLRGYTCWFSDIKIDLNNYLYWRVARLVDNGVRTLDDACTMRCLIVHI